MNQIKEQIKPVILYTKVTYNIVSFLLMAYGAWQLSLKLNSVAEALNIIAAK